MCVCGWQNKAYLLTKMLYIKRIQYINPIHKSVQQEPKSKETTNGNHHTESTNGATNMDITFEQYSIAMDIKPLPGDSPNGSVKNHLTVIAQDLECQPISVLAVDGMDL